MNHDPVLSEAAVRYGCLRVRDLVAVHQGSSPAERLKAVTTVWEYFGFNDDAKAEVAALIDEYLTPESDSAVLLGFLIGLYAFDYET